MHPPLLQQGLERLASAAEPLRHLPGALDAAAVRPQTRERLALAQTAAVLVLLQLWPGLPHPLALAVLSVAAAARLAGRAAGMWSAALVTASYLVAPAPQAPPPTAGAVALLLALSLSAATLGAARGALPARAQDEIARRSEEALAVVAHDLQNLIASIALLADLLLLRRPSSTYSVQDSARRILVATDVMQRMVRDLLDVSRIRRGGLLLDRRPVALDAVVERAVDLARPLCERRRIRLRWPATGPTAMAHADPDRLFQVLANLLDNAIRFTPDGGVIAVEIRRAGAFHCVTVSDSGPGLSPGAAALVFEQFWRGEEPGTAREGGGLGLGLTIARGVVRAHGGEIGVTAAEGGGCAFHFTVPACEPVAALEA